MIDFPLTKGILVWKGKFDALYFSVVTLTTVGDKDFSSQTDFGKIFTILYIFIGIGLVFGFIHKLTVNVQLPSILSNRKKSKACNCFTLFLHYFRQTFAVA